MTKSGQGRRVPFTGGAVFLGSAAARRVVVLRRNGRVLRLTPFDTGTAEGRSNERCRRDGQPPRALDTSRARQFFGFEGSTPFMAGIRWSVAWRRSQSTD